MPAVSHPVFATHLNLPGRRQGKVRDIYELPGTPPKVVIVASDRISAFDVVMPSPMTGKGKVLTEISTFWFGFIQKRNLSPTHLISTNELDIPASALGDTTYEQLRGRVTIGKKCSVIPVECVVRGYLEGSGWKDYQATGSVCGVKLPAGLRQCDKLPQPIFTPATKAPQGQHDENISFERACQEVGKELMTTLRDRTIAIYTAAADYARSRGIIIADTKFEFGLEGNSKAPILIDEALTPDSSRFWPLDGYTPGRAQKSFDKQFLREYLQELVDQGKWNKQAPGPEVPEAIMQGTLAKYAEARERLCR